MRARDVAAAVIGAWMGASLGAFIVVVHVMAQAVIR